MRSRAAIRDYPIHPMLIAIPISLFLWTLVADFLYLSLGHAVSWYHLAFWTSIAGILSAIVAAIPGFLDYAGLPLDPEVRRIATWHMAVNVAVVVTFSVAAGLMAHHAAIAGARLWWTIGLHLAACSLLGVSVWLGGELVYRHGVAVLDDEDEELVQPSIGGRGF